MGDRRQEVTLVPVGSSDRAELETMALLYFRELDPGFELWPEWQERFFPALMTGARQSAWWIMADGARAGFAILGLELHRYLPKVTGSVLDFYVSPEFRRAGLGTAGARAALDRLRDLGAQKFQIEIMNGNARAEEFWRTLRFVPYAQRWVLHG